MTAIRLCRSSAGRAKGKGRLPLASWAGKFTRHNDACRIAASGFVYVDVDPASDKKHIHRLEDEQRRDAAELREAVRHDAAKCRDLLAEQPWCAAAWVSATAFGIGVLVPGDATRHARAAVETPR